MTLQGSERDAGPRRYLTRCTVDRTDVAQAGEADDGLSTGC